MKPLKERGLQVELKPLVRRLKRAYAMERISHADFQYCLTRLEEVEARIVSMTEHNRAGEELFDG